MHKQEIPLNFIELQADFVTLAAHKNHGPKGAGALLAHPEALKKIVPLFHGGNQENGFRSGTLNVPLIVGLVQCFALYETESVQNYSHMKKLWERLYNELIKPFPRVSLNGPVGKRLYSNFNFYVQDTGFQKFQEIMPHVAFSGSGACASHAGGSSTLRALGLPEHQVQNSVRFGLSRYTTEAEIAYVIETITSQILIR
ncbi:MAG: aminotransferase class V-fold PLP-dependent enzyme [Ignavibacteriales bacterium]|nr:aminotransferase class V-fold PLP-dependent enzyme [Ignavibacteriales bacterium]